jgi:hypothetical protein
MHQIAYTSVATDRMKAEDLVRIVQESVHRNAERGITGFLLFRGGKFVQLIEGPRKSLTDLIDTLCADPRHTDLTIIHDEAIAERQFPNWRMKRLTPNSNDALAELRAQLGEANAPKLPRPVEWEIAREAA